MVILLYYLCVDFVWAYSLYSKDTEPFSNLSGGSLSDYCHCDDITGNLWTVCDQSRYYHHLKFCRWAMISLRSWMQYQCSSIDQATASTTLRRPILKPLPQTHKWVPKYPLQLTVLQWQETDWACLIQIIYCWDLIFAHRLVCLDYPHWSAVSNVQQQLCCRPVVLLDM
jgi:hypothetical protein